MLKGEKILLRAVERDDLKRLHELARNVDLVILGDGHWQPEPLAAFERNFEQNLDAAEHAWFAIEADSRVVGRIGLVQSNRRNGTAEFGIEIYDPTYVGKGYGRDAITVFLDWAFRIQNYRRIWLKTSAENERAIRCYRAVGFVEEGRLRQQLYDDGQYVDSVLMGLLRSEWDERQGKRVIG
jgi:RimJ/RimL family protein N-acetyltransferase